MLHPFLADVAMHSTEIPFATAAVNIRSGDLHVFRGADRLRQAVVASASMPLIFPPERIGSESYVDGGVLDKLGIETAVSYTHLKRRIRVEIPRDAFCRCGLNILNGLYHADWDFAYIYADSTWSAKPIPENAQPVRCTPSCFAASASTSRFHSP